MRSPKRPRKPCPEAEEKLIPAPGRPSSEDAFDREAVGSAEPADGIADGRKRSPGIGGLRVWIDTGQHEADRSTRKDESVTADVALVARGTKLDVRSKRLNGVGIDAFNQGGIGDHVERDAHARM